MVGPGVGVGVSVGGSVGVGVGVGAAAHVPNPCSLILSHINPAQHPVIIVHVSPSFTHSGGVGVGVAGSVGVGVGAETHAEQFVV